MNCFVASAFDYDDVDAMYDRAVRPVLSELRLRPLRVDRVEYNEDIDDQIFKLIDQSQLCIADLSYARPSVYYEAGYAFGTGKPVIYLARRDHFRPREDDAAGNFRVHFDLQMKNIIPWTEPNETFKRRLRTRLKHVLRPIFRDRQLAQAKRQEEQRFAATSQNERLMALLNKARSLLRARGYSRIGFPEDRPSGWDPYHAHLQKTFRRSYRQVHILARPAVNKAGLDTLAFFWSTFLTREQYDQIKKIESACIVVALRSVRSATLTTLFPSWTPVSNRMFLKTDMPSLRDKIPHSGTVVVIDGVKSLQEFTERFREVIKELEKGQQRARQQPWGKAGTFTD